MTRICASTPGIRCTPPTGNRWEPSASWTRPHDFDDDKQELLRDLAFWVQTELTRYQELDHAEVIQRAMLPQRQLEVPGYTIASAAVPRGVLSGDFYDLAVYDGVLRVTLADVSGKGGGPALVAAGVRASLRTLPGRPLAEAVVEADRLVEADLGDTGMFVTAVHADIDLDTGRVQLVDAGHGLAFIVCENGRWRHLRSAGLPLGMGESSVEEREPTVAHLEPGDHFVCFSDGLLDMLDPEDPYGHAEQVIRASGPHGAVREAVLRSRDDDITDDVTVIVIRRDR